MPSAGDTITNSTGAIRRHVRSHLNSNFPYSPAAPHFERCPRTEDENKERAYIAASRRSDRSMDARFQSAKEASKLHFERTGRHLDVTMEAVLENSPYDELDEGVQPRDEAPSSGTSDAPLEKPSQSLGLHIFNNNYGATSFQPPSSNRPFYLTRAGGTNYLLPHHPTSYRPLPHPTAAMAPNGLSQVVSNAPSIKPSSNGVRQSYNGQAARILQDLSTSHPLRRSTSSRPAIPRLRSSTNINTPQYISNSSSLVQANNGTAIRRARISTPHASQGVDELSTSSLQASRLRNNPLELPAFSIPQSTTSSLSKQVPPAIVDVNLANLPTSSQDSGDMEFDDFINWKDDEGFTIANENEGKVEQTQLQEERKLQISEFERDDNYDRWNNLDSSFDSFGHHSSYENNDSSEILV